MVSNTKVVWIRQQLVCEQIILPAEACCSLLPPSQSLIPRCRYIDNHCSIAGIISKLGSQVLCPQLLHLIWFNVVANVIVVPAIIALVGTFPDASLASHFRQGLVLVLFAVLVH